MLIAVTSHSGPLGRRPTGAWLGEITTFWDEVARAGLAVEIASPIGGHPPIDPVSALIPSRSKLELAGDPRTMLARTQRSVDVDPSRYDAIYFAGGHGALWDFPSDPGFLLATEAIWREGGIVAAVCHGSAALLAAKDADGQPLLERRRATGYSNLEERLSRLDEKVPFLLETAMREKGARYERAPLPFARHVVVDGSLITGQNPLSARAVGRAVVARLRDPNRRPRRTSNGARRPREDASHPRG